MMTTSTLILLCSPPAAFAVICIVLTASIERADRPARVREPAPSLVPVPALVPSPALPDCPAIAGSVTGAAWMEFLTDHDLGGTT